jgi:hypothetical protein
MARATELLTEAGEATGATMRRAVDEVRHNRRDHRHALQTFHETAKVSAEFGHGWRDRLERHVAVLVTMVEGERAAGRTALGPLFHQAQLHEHRRPPPHLRSSTTTAKEAATANRWTPRMSARNRGQCHPGTGAASEKKCHPATGATVARLSASARTQARPRPRAG